MLDRKHAKILVEKAASCCPTCGTFMAYIRTIWRNEPKIDIWYCAPCMKAAHTPSRETKH